MPTNNPNKTIYRKGSDGHTEFFKQGPFEDKTKKEMSTSDLSFLAMKYLIEHPQNIAKQNDQRATAISIASPIVKQYPQINISLVEKAHNQLMQIQGYSGIYEKVKAKANKDLKPKR